MDFNVGDVVVVPFPFTDRTAAKRRPSLVLSSRERFGTETGQCLLAMITSAKHSAWPLDCRVTDLGRAGLDADCVVRMKLFTLDGRLILRKAGVLCDADMGSVRAAMSNLLG